MKLTELELGRLANNIQELLYNASDICHDRSVKFLMARAKVRSSDQTTVGVSSLMSKLLQVSGLMSETSEMAFSIEINSLFPLSQAPDVKAQSTQALTYYVNARQCGFLLLFVLPF